MQSVYLIVSNDCQERHDEVAIQFRNAGYSVYSRTIAEQHYHAKFSGGMTDNQRVKVGLQRLLSCDGVAYIGTPELNEPAFLENNVAIATGKKIFSVKGFK